MEIATTIIQQLGGKKFSAMTGAHLYRVTASKKGVAFSIPKAQNNVKHVVIELMDDDTYTMEFIDKMGTSVKEFEGVYSDMLQNIFSATTGLSVSL